MLLLFVCLFLVFVSCASDKKLEYYSQNENYVTAKGTVEYIRYNDDGTELYMEFSDLIPEFDDTCFKFSGDNVSVVRENGIDDKIKLGDRIEFVTAPRYFGDGYVMPIVSVTVNGETLLESDEGISNLLEWLKK